MKRGTDRAGEPSDASADSESLRESLCGKTLGERYRVETLLARGGMGTVYIGRHLLLDTKVAIKVAKLSASVGAEARFLREARLACRFRHPNLVQIFDGGLVGERMGYLVMELLPHRTLADCLDRESLDLFRACRIALETAKGLRAMHERGVIHCDPHPPAFPS